jgi:isoamylase
MRESFTVRPAEPYPLGVKVLNASTVRVSEVFDNTGECGIIFCRGLSGHTLKVPLETDGSRHGRIISCEIETGPEDPLTDGQGRVVYRFYCGERKFIGKHAEGISEKMNWMQAVPASGLHAAAVSGCREIAPEPRIPLSDAVFYMLSVRAFTMHSSSGVKERGTFEGVVRKTDYIKSLGVTDVIIMPAYEFDERMDDGMHHEDSMEYAVRHYKDRPSEKTAVRCNMWGYTGNAFYYMPKSAFSASGNAGRSFAGMVDALHKDGLELIMQMYFEPSQTVREILSILEYWVLTYHVDGFQLIGGSIPVRDISGDPLLSDRKLLFDRWQTDGNTAQDGMTAAMDDGFENDLRHFLKGDAYVISNMISYIRGDSFGTQNVHYIARQEGMRLIDLVTYNEKHNEHNGEHNGDGRSDDISWNCGVEGNTRRQAVTRLRLRQMKNAIAMVLLTQGIPLIYSGDEFGNTQYGNNNPYCQDNAEGWVKWGSSGQSRELLEWTRSMIGFREKYRILHMSEPFKGTDYLSCAYPDISLHGVDAWRTQNIPGCHLIAVMYCMRYGCSSDEGLIYAVFNMHWEAQKISLPKPFSGQKWILYRESCAEAGDIFGSTVNEAVIPARSIAVLISEKDQSTEKSVKSK